MHTCTYVVTYTQIHLLTFLFILLFILSQTVQVHTHRIIRTLVASISKNAWQVFAHYKIYCAMLLPVIFQYTYPQNV